MQGGNSVHNLQTFGVLYKKLEQAMDIIVDTYYKGFGNAIHIFGGVVDNISQSQDRVRKIKTSFEAAQGKLQVKRVDLPTLWSRSAQYKEMVELIYSM